MLKRHLVCFYDDTFHQFITERQPEDRWTFQLDKVTKRHPLRAQQLWHWFLIERVEAGFKCSVIKPE